MQKSKTSLLLLSFSAFFSVCGQTYSTLISDSVITAFFKELALSSELKIKKVDSKITQFYPGEIYDVPDSVPRSFGLKNGLLKSDTILKYFGTDNISFIENQLRALQDSIWHPKDFKQFELLDSIGLLKIHKNSVTKKKVKGNYCHDFSTPIFSRDRKTVFMKVDLYCGFMCATYCYCIYRKNTTKGKWKKVVEWNCLAS